MAIFTNQAALTYNGLTTLSNTVTGELMDVLTVNKSATPATYRPGETVTYVVNITNTGTAPLSGLTLTDNLGAYSFGTGTLYPLTYGTGSLLYFINGTPTAGPTVTAPGSGPMTVSPLSIPAGGTATLVYEAAANEYADPTDAGVISNIATVTGPGVADPISGTATITADARPVLTISKALSPAQVTENGQLTYTFTVTNTGNAPVGPDAGAVITDTFTPALDPISVTLNGAAWNRDTQYSYAPDTGRFATTAGSLSVPSASYTRDPVTGAWQTDPGITTVEVTGTV